MSIPTCTIDPSSCDRCRKAVPWFSFFGNLTLAIYKMAIGLIGGSAALVADAAHSFSDVVGSLSIVIATKVSAKAPSRGNPYGFGKSEFLGAMFVYTVLSCFSLGIIITAITAMLHPNLRAPHAITLFGAVISVGYNYLMYKYTECVGKRNNSPAILADSFENRADAISSVACIAGIAGGVFIHPICDPLAALLVGIIIGTNCYSQLKEAIHGLMDEGIELKGEDIIKQMVYVHESVLGIEFFRSRQTGAHFWVDLGINVDPDLAVAEADALVADLRTDILRHPDVHHLEVFVLPITETSNRRPEPPARLDKDAIRRDSNKIRLSILEDNV